MIPVKVLLCLFFLKAAIANAQTFHLGTCPKPSVQASFNVTNYMGTWYEMEKLPAMFERGKCIQATYSLLSDGTVEGVHTHSTTEERPIMALCAHPELYDNAGCFYQTRDQEGFGIEVTQQGCGSSRSNGKISSIEGVAKVKDASEPAKLEVGFFKGVPDAPYWVLSTDYQSYALVYSCSDYFGFFHIDFAWILARTRTLSEDVISNLHNRLSAAGIDINRLMVSDQTGCEEPNQ